MALFRRGRELTRKRDDVSLVYEYELLAGKGEVAACAGTCHSWLLLRRQPATAPSASHRRPFMDRAASFRMLSSCSILLSATAAFFRTLPRSALSGRPPPILAQALALVHPTPGSPMRAICRSWWRRDMASWSRATTRLSRRTPSSSHPRMTHAVTSHSSSLQQPTEPPSGHALGTQTSVSGTLTLTNVGNTWTGSFSTVLPLIDGGTTPLSGNFETTTTCVRH